MLTLTERTRRVAVALAALAALLLLGHALRLLHDTDDLFISLRYSANIARGLGPVFSAGERVEGFTPPLWVFSLGALGTLGLPLFGTARAAGLLAGVAALLLVPWVAARRGWRGGLLAAFLVALNSSFALWSASAMEITLASALTLAALGARRPALSALFMGLAVLTRPESATWGVLIGFWWLVEGYRVHGLDRVSTAVRYGAAALAVTLPYLLFRYAFYGDWLPNTFYVKAALSEQVLLRGAEYLAAAGRDYFWSLTLWALLALLLPATWRRGGWLLWALIAAQLAYVISFGGDWMAGYRFVVMIVPLVAIQVGRAAASVGEALARRGPAWLRAAPAALLVALSLVTALQVGPRFQQDIYFRQPWVPDGFAMAEAIKAHCAAGTSMALFAAGALPFGALDYPVVDMFGLVTPEIARSPDSYVGGVMPGHDRFDPAATRALRPHLYIFHAELDSAPIVDEKGWREGLMAHLVTRFTDDPAFWAEHSTRSVELTPGRYFNFVQRHDAPCVWP